MPQSLLHGFQVGASGNVMRCHRVPQAVNGGALYAGLGKILRHGSLNRPLAQRPAEFGGKQRVVSHLEPWAGCKPGLDRSADLEVEGDRVLLTAFAKDVGKPHAIRIGADPAWQFDIRYPEPRHLCKPEASLEEQFDKRRVSRVVRAGPKQCPVLLFREKPRLTLGRSRRDEPISQVTDRDTMLVQESEEAFGRMRLAPPS